MLIKVKEGLLALVEQLLAVLRRIYRYTTWLLLYGKLLRKVALHPVAA